ncbi:MAG: tRNA pseudouridine(55) synthase TruB [Acidimicrobiales bacterium]
MARRSKRPDSGVSGCCIIDKPAGMTSHDVVDRLRRSLGTRKVGHAGTLDPDATGVLVLGVGKATKLLQFVSGADKTYECEVVFGTETNTLDAAGEVTSRHDMADLRPEQVAEAAEQFVGDILQVPPMVSAIKIDGKRLHELAREGIEVEREARPVTVFSLATAATDDPLVYTMAVHCSSGTYVRTLGADLGTALGGGAHIRALRRPSVGPFTLADASTLDEPVLLPVGEMLRGMPRLEVDDDVLALVRNGRPLGESAGSGRFAICNHAGDVVAIYEAVDGLLKPLKVLAH